MEAVAMPEFSFLSQIDAGRVLIADDQPHILDAVQMLLRGNGFSTQVVTHPARRITGAVLGETVSARSGAGRWPDRTRRAAVWHAL